MSLQRRRGIPSFRPPNDIELNWETFAGGWNALFKPTELRPNELTQSDNLMLVGKGTPTGRWGSVTYNLAGTGRVRLLDAYYNSLTSTNHFLSITDAGYMVKKSGASYALITGASFASGYNYQSVELGGNTYIASASQNFIKYDGNQLIPYTALSTPTNVSVAQLSAASGFNTYSWVITATSQTGETLGSVAKTLASLPLDLSLTAIKISWNTVSAAASVLSGYNIYRGFPGDETLIDSVGADAVQYTDIGNAASNTIFPPQADTTAGPKAKYILKLDDRIVLAGIKGDPSKVLISARYPYHDRFTALDGGGYCYVSPNDGDDITGLGLANIQTTTPLLVVYKNYSTHLVGLDVLTLGNYKILDPIPHLLTSSFGSSSGDTIIGVENDTFAFGRKGLYSTGQEPQYLNQIRTNEISARIRPYIQNLSDVDFKEASAAYLDYKYILSFPTKKETIIYDRQRGAFMGPWKTPFGITKWFKHIDESGSERWIAGCDDGYNREFSSAYISDSGTAIVKLGRTAKSDFGNWSTFKILKYFYFLLRNVRGSVTVSLRLETRDGNTVTAKTATISSSLGSSGWGADTSWGDTGGASKGGGWGQTDATVSITGDELARYAQIFKQCRVLQVEFSSTGANSNFEFLSVRATAQSLGPSSLPSTLKV